MTPNTAPAAHPRFEARLRGLDALGTGALAFVVGVYAVGVLFLLLGLTITPVSGGIGILAGLALPRLLRLQGPGFALPAAVLGLAAATHLVAACWLDISWDGLAYHQPAVIQLLEGWNPFRGPTDLANVAAWTTEYPKASWITAAQVVSLVGQIECGKGINFLTLVATLCVAIPFCAARLPSRPKLAVLGGAAIALNPVSVYQAPTFYVDGLLGSLLTILFLDLITLLAEQATRATHFRIAAAVLLLINLKFTGLVYCVLVLGTGIAVLAARREFAHAIRLGTAWGLLGIAGIFVFGASPYARNVLEGRHLFYPLQGPGAVDIMTPIRPANLTPLDRFSRFAAAHFARSENVRTPQSTRWAVPFFAVAPDNYPRSYIDTTSAGFGPLFGGAMLLAALGLAWGLGRDRRIGPLVIFTLGAMGLTVFLHAEGWWARYVPQLWLLAALGVPWLATRGLLRLSGGLLVVLLLNTAMVGSPSAAQKLWATLLLKRELAEIKSTAGRIELQPGPFPALARRTREAGIPTVVTSGATPDGPGWRSFKNPTDGVAWRPAATTAP